MSGLYSQVSHSYSIGKHAISDDCPGGVINCAFASPFRAGGALADEARKGLRCATMTRLSRPERLQLARAAKDGPLRTGT